MTSDVTSMKISVPMCAPTDPIEPWVERMAAQGVELFLQGLEGRAVAVWKRALRLEPAHKQLLTYLSIVGELPKGPGTRRPTIVELTVQWNATGLVFADGGQRGADGGAELYEVLRDRALRAFRAKAWDLARSLLEACARRCPSDKEIILLLEGVHNQTRRREVRRRAA